MAFMGPLSSSPWCVLFLLDHMGARTHWMDFGTYLAALLIVIACLSCWSTAPSTNGHIPREYNATLPPNAAQPIPPEHTQVIPTTRVIGTIRFSRKARCDAACGSSGRLHRARFLGASPDDREVAQWLAQICILLSRLRRRRYVVNTARSPGH